MLCWYRRMVMGCNPISLRTFLLLQMNDLFDWFSKDNWTIKEKNRKEVAASSVMIIYLLVFLFSSSRMLVSVLVILKPAMHLVKLRLLIWSIQTFHCKFIFEKLPYAINYLFRLSSVVCTQALVLCNVPLYGCSD